MSFHAPKGRIDGRRDGQYTSPNQLPPHLRRLHRRVMHAKRQERPEVPVDANGKPWAGLVNVAEKVKRHVRPPRSDDDYPAI